MTIDPPGATHPQRPAGSRWLAALSALCIVIGAVLVPVSIVGAWARAELVDADRFASTFGPLVDDPEVQALLIDRVTAAVDEQVDISGLTDDLFDGIASLDLPPRSLAALDLLRAPAAQGAKSVITEAATRVVESDAFARVWDRALRASHAGLVAAATGGTEGVVTIDGEGVVGIQLAPIVAEVRQRLIDQGFGFASAIPVVDRTIVIAQSDALVTVRIVYALAVAVGGWLPLITLLFFVGGVLAARRKSTAMLGVGVGAALGGVTLTVALAIGATVLGVSAADLGVPSGALSAVYEQVIAAMRQTAIVVAVIGVIVAVIAWSRGRWRAAVLLRGAVNGINESIRRTLSQRASAEAEELQGVGEAPPGGGGLDVGGQHEVAGR